MLVTESAAAQEGRGADLLHSDLPLWAGAPDVMWPRHFNEENSFGCANRARLGNWRFRDRETDDDAWYRFANYGVFHCAMLVSDARDQASLGGRYPDLSFLIELGSAHGIDGEVELWALQRGTRPGSSYLLLSRTAGGEIITEFDVLQRRCPSGSQRRGPTLDSFLTSYCAINSRRELIQLAQRMARLPPLGRLTFVSAVEEGD